MCFRVRRTLFYLIDSTYTHSKKNLLSGKLKTAQIPFRKPFLVYERVSSLLKRFQLYLGGFRGLGNLSVFDNTDFDARKVFQNTF